MKVNKRLMGLLVGCGLLMPGHSWAAGGLMSGQILLAQGGEAKMVIGISSGASLTERFAASELSAYLRKISGAVFRVEAEKKISSPKIILSVTDHLKSDAYMMDVRGPNILLLGGSPRAILYAVYDFLGRLGCRWPAPEFSYEDGGSSHIPHRSQLSFSFSGPIHQSPAFAYRKLDVEEGRSHDTANLKQLIDWMAKHRFNVLMIPLDYGGNGKVEWDRWRKALTPELKKRGILIEVGGHGYQNFLNAGMEDSTLFTRHPGWFGKDSECRPSPLKYQVFNTADPAAVSYFIGHILQYLREHPEIDLFDFWPPDGARWADCPELDRLGSARDRQAQLANQVDSAIKTIRPGLRLEIIAYGQVLLPPGKIPLNPDILVDFCPIDQSFEKQIYDSSAANNASYVRAIHAWRQAFGGEVSLYSYYRKYAWHSLPNLIPHYMQKDLRWYRSVPLQGISCYCEPGDWGTYALNYYVLAHLAWDPAVSVDSLIGVFCRLRYGAAWKTAELAYASLERIVPRTCHIPFTPLKQSREIAQGAAELLQRQKAVQSALESTAEIGVSGSLTRLLLMLQYAGYDLQIQEALSRHETPEEIGGKMQALARFLEGNRDKGVFLVGSEPVLPRLMNYYGLSR